MKQPFLIIFSAIGLSFIVLFASCTSTKNIRYFKDIGSEPALYEMGKDIAITPYQSLTILPDDILNVTITTIDQEANGAANISSADASKFSFSTSGLPTTSANTAYGYLVDKNGFITLPVLGKVVVGGKTIVEIQDIILDKASKIFKEPTINVRLMNFKVTVLGEVLKPGTYITDGERVSILSALGLAGDLTIFGKRKNVLLIRQDGENNKKMVRLDLNDSHLFTSPYYYLKQGDVLYVEPTKGKAAANDVAFTRNYAIASSVITLVIVLITRFKF